MKPLLRWVGSKQWLAPRLREMWLQDGARRFCEPFCGGLGATMGVEPLNALLNDSNSHLIGLYRALAQGIPLAYTEDLNTANTYYQFRSSFNAMADGIPKYLLFYYLNRTCYRGLCRYNKSGNFNTPYGNRDWAQFIRPEECAPYAELFSRWQFTCGDFGSMALQRGDFVYADPPYDDAFGDYTENGFSWKDQQRLAGWLAAHDGYVVVSNAATDRIIDLYKSLGFTCEVVDAPRRISNEWDTVQEMLAYRRGVA